ncbi:hypothetical protein CsSME_00029477 [Camellia sinensis var. sinensis]
MADYHFPMAGGLSFWPVTFHSAQKVVQKHSGDLFRTVTGVQTIVVGTQFAPSPKKGVRGESSGRSTQADVKVRVRLTVVYLESRHVEPFRGLKFPLRCVALSIVMSPLGPISISCIEIQFLPLNVPMFFGVSFLATCSSVLVCWGTVGIVFCPFWALFLAAGIGVSCNGNGGCMTLFCIMKLTIDCIYPSILEGHPRYSTRPGLTFLTKVLRHFRSLITYPLISDSDIPADNLDLAEITSASRACGTSAGTSTDTQMGLKKWVEESRPFLSMLMVQVFGTVLQLLIRVVLSEGTFIFALVAYRHVVGAVCVAPFAFFFERGKGKKLSCLVCFWLFMNALTGISITMVFFYYGLRDTTASYAVNFLNLVPIVTFLFSIIAGIGTNGQPDGPNPASYDRATMRDDQCSSPGSITTKLSTTPLRSSLCFVELIRGGPHSPI